MAQHLPERMNVSKCERVMIAVDLLAIIVVGEEPAIRSKKKFKHLWAQFQKPEEIKKNKLIEAGIIKRK